MLKQIRLNFISVLFILAVLALVLIQVAQMARIYDKKNNEFNDRFSTTMDLIALKHEKAEDLKKYMHLSDKDFSVQYKDILKSEFQDLLSASESISIQDTTIFKDGELQNYLIIKGKTYDSLSGIIAEQSVLAKDVRKLRDLFSSGKPKNKDSVDLAIRLDQRVLQQIFKKARFVNQMMLEAFRTNVYESPEKRFDINFLDSVIRFELAEEDLPKEYQFCVTDQYNIPVNFSDAPEYYNKEIDTLKSQQTMLFPTNPLDNDLYLHLTFNDKKSILWADMWMPLLVNLGLLSLIVVTISFMFKTILKQRKLSEVKNDFISNMTHEFKTPISTISLACQAMNDSDMINTSVESVTPYVKMIREENNRLSSLVEQILQSASLDKGEIQLRIESINLNEMIDLIIKNSSLRITSLKGTLNVDITDTPIIVSADRMHLTNTISNLIDNAIKYSTDTVEIGVSLQIRNNIVELSISDKGIGMKKEYLPKIFDKLYRIPTGNVHNVKGFGLGLSYVNAIIELHNWEIKVSSKLNQGTTFTLLMPQQNGKTN